MEPDTVKERRRKNKVAKKRKHNEIDAKDEEQGHKSAGPEYILKDGLRYVKKYNHVFRGYTKKRWLGKSIYQICKDEFQAYSNQYYHDAILSGRVKVNNTKVPLDYEMKDGDQIQHYAERLESPIIDCEIKIISEDDQFLVVDKPPSMPVHPCGNINYNCLKSILEQEFKHDYLRVVHRLDKQTSGIVFFAKTADAANEFKQNLEVKDAIKKVYFARIKGKLESEEDKLVVDQPIWFKSTDFYSTEPPDTSEKTLKKGKESKTIFEFQFYDEESNTSVVKCYPITGRTHQIRVHLAHLGYPIANDVNYGGMLFNDIDFLETSQADGARSAEDAKEETKEDIEELKRPENDDSEDIEYSPKMIEKSCIKFWLHAYQYTFKDQCYSTEIPDWAKEDYIPNMKF
ncbi:unnamed protein product [Moneuplotes crassus]|uniref:Pseudouridine synthase n=1 Tax=Euplotes crassus TaxID=5936 RepID=A0AAD1XFX6_EUPCR|nr:unnamed protein product [Moneuplotes crassus]